MLIHFPPEALDPTDKRLLSYAVRMIPELLDVGLWDKEKTLNVSSYLIWQHSTSESVGYLLEDLIARDPNEPIWSFYLAELYHRQEQFDRAKAVYQQVLGMDPSYAQAYLRLGMVSEAAGEPLSEAIRWYTQYSALVPNDLLGLRHLTEMCTVLEETGTEMGSCQEAALRFSSSVTPVSPSGSPMSPGETVAASPISSPTVILRAVLDERTDDHVIVAGLLDLPVEDIELGPNLVGNGEFEAWTDGTPRGWMWSAMFNKAPFQSAAFWGGAEDLLAYGGGRAARVQGSWVGSEEEKSPARAGFWHGDISTSVSIPYVISFSYCTIEVLDDGELGIWLSYDPGIFWSYVRRLPQTSGTWQRFVAVSWNRSDYEASIRPLISLFDAGRLVFDDIQVRTVYLRERYRIESTDTKFWLSEKE
jgi:tetratricopeptide (TPR) repeat protein